MKTAIDRSGRVLIPKTLRQQASLAPGTPLEARFDAGRIVLEPRPLAARVERRGRFFVAEPEEPVPPMAAAMVDATIDRLRTRDDEH